jgi:aminoglycoside 2''-phosphotransferase
MDTSIEHYIGLIKKYFPKIPLVSPKLITKGWDNDVVILDDKFVFRFPKREKYFDRFKAEIKLLRYLSPKMPVPVPDYQYTPGDLSFGGYKIIPGVEMTPEVFNTFTDSQKKRIAEQLGKFLSVMHDTSVEKAKEFGFEEEDEGYWWSRNHTEQTLQGLREKVFPKLTKEEIDWVEQQFDQYSSLSFDFEITVIHSDLVGDHIFVDPEKGMVTGIIDFADTEFSDPALDFAGMWHYGEQFPQQVLNNYEHKTDSDFLKRSKFPILVHMVGNMLEIENGNKLPVTFEESRKKLNECMASGLSL